MLSAWYTILIKYILLFIDLIKQHQDKFRCNQNFIIMQVCIIRAPLIVLLVNVTSKIACNAKKTTLENSKYMEND